MTYGFVKFQSSKDAAIALRDMSGYEIAGKKIKVGYARRGLDSSNSKVFVKRLPPHYTFVDVHRLFLQVLSLFFSLFFLKYFNHFIIL